MRGWLFRIMHTTWIDMYRVRRARPEEVLTREFSEYQTQMIGAESVEDRVLDRLPDADIAEAFRQLPADFRAVLYFADVQGYRTSEIADLLDTPVGTVSSRLHRGRTKLRGLLADTASARGYGALT